MTTTAPVIRDLAVIGDGRTAALISRDGTVQWLCLPDLDSPSVFANLLDTDRGGSFLLRPAMFFGASRRYLRNTNVLETTYTTSGGVVRVTEAMTFAGPGLMPERELVRRVEGVSGLVPMRWRFEPRLDYGAKPVALERNGSTILGRAGGRAFALRTWGAGQPCCRPHVAHGHFGVAAGQTACLSLVSAHGEPLVMPSLEEVEARLQATIGYWKAWASGLAYDGPWREAVVRSALALKLLIHAPSGAIAAAATSSLPEKPSGEGAWDYRFCWPRDAAFTVDALLSLGCPREASAFFSWLMHATQLTHPGVRALYRLNGRQSRREEQLPLEGYDGGAVWVGNAAASQLQLDVFGEVIGAAARIARAEGLDRDTARRVAGMANEVCRRWREPDHGVWELRGKPAHYTHSKMLCAATLTTAVSLAEEGHLPRAARSEWRAAADDITRFIEIHCWSDGRDSYTCAANDARLDAAVLLGLIAGYRPDVERWHATVAAVRADLADGDLVWRFLEDGEAREGAFLACTFWLASALSRLGRHGEAAAMLERAIGLANDVGLFAEEIDERTGAFRGNFPQGFVHLALIDAAKTIASAQR